MAAVPGSLLDLAQQACAAAGRRASNAEDIEDAKQIINRGLLMVVNNGEEWDFQMSEESLSIVAGTDEYALSAIGTGMDRIESVVFDSADVPEDRPLEKVSWLELERAFLSTQVGQENGVPIMFAYYSGNIRFAPTPDRAITARVRGRLSQAQLVDDADLPTMPLKWSIPVLVPYAAARLLRQDGGAQGRLMAAEYEGEHREALEAMTRAEARGFGLGIRLRGPDFMQGAPGSIVQTADFD